ncbi:hypothetical protein LTR85_008801 [Meristemomyces frigidus]|nr:hypothetical protein LTR85_008801 [Meristemomyces frigidus]
MNSHSQMIVASRSSGAEIQLTSSPFMQLPGELRNRVYDDVLEDLPTKTTNIIRSNRSLLPHPLGALFRVSREVTMYWVRDSSFGVFMRDAGQNRRGRSQVVREAKLFTTMMGPHLSSIAHLELGLDDLDLFFNGLVSEAPTPFDFAAASGTARQALLQSWQGGHPSEPISALADLWAAVHSLATCGMQNVTTVTLHANQIDSFPSLTMSGADTHEKDDFFILLRILFRELADLRVVHAAPVPCGRRFRCVSCVEEDGEMWVAVCIGVV